MINSEQIKALIDQIRADIETRKNMPEFGANPDAALARINTINETRRSFTPDTVEKLLGVIDADKALIEDSENRVRKQNRHVCELFDENKSLRQRIAELEARTLTVKLPTAYDLSGEVDGNCSLNDASMKPDANGCYFRRRDVEQACAAAGITLDVGE